MEKRGKLWADLKEIDDTLRSVPVEITKNWEQSLLEIQKLDEHSTFILAEHQRFMRHEQQHSAKLRTEILSSAGLAGERGMRVSRKG